MSEESLSTWRREVLENAVLGDIDIPFPKATDPNTASQIWKKFLDEVMDRLITKRRKCESDIINNGKTPVWFSHDVDKGGLKHWLVMLHDTKYELRKNQNACCHRVACEHGVAGFCCIQHECGKSLCCRGHQCRSRSTCPNHAPGCQNSRLDGYYFKKSPIVIDIEQRERAITQLGKPQKDRYYIGLIGSTSMTSKDVDERFKARMREFGDYHLFSNNCQHFVVEVAKQIVEEKAPDWKWFTDNLVSAKSHDYVKPLQGVPIDVVAAWAETLKEQRNNLPEEDRAKVDRNIRILEQCIYSFKKRVAEGQNFNGPPRVGFFPYAQEQPWSGGGGFDDGYVDFDSLEGYEGGHDAGMPTTGDFGGTLGSYDTGGSSMSHSSSSHSSESHSSSSCGGGSSSY